jgi:thiamine biosynthesis protein ThiI
MSESSMWIVRYAEIGLKGDNRPFFEIALVRDIQRRLASCGAPAVTRTRGRLWVADEPRYREQVRRELRLLPGIHSFSLAQRCANDLDTLKACGLAMLRAAWPGDRPTRFRVTTRRSDKRYPMLSAEVSRILGACLLQHSEPGLLSVSLTEPELNLHVELHADFAAMHLIDEPGAGGLPVGTAGNVLCLLSGGIDSPVAAWQMIRRGCRVHHVFFENRAFLGRGAYDKVERLARRLAVFQGRSTLTAVPFSDIQVAIRDQCEPRHRVVLYRRFMYRIAERLMRRHRCLGLVTGENIGQVASQTLENLRAVDVTVDACVYRPLLSMDKTQIIEIARRIDTFEISIEEAADCCSVFLPKHPVTRARIEELEADECRLDVTALEQSAIEKAECLQMGEAE